MNNLPIIFCVGSSKFLPDSLGPRVGDFLKYLNVPTFVYGDSKNNIDALNLKETYLFIKSKHKNRIMLVVDASLCYEKEYKKIIAKNSGILSTGCKFIIGDKSLIANLYCIDTKKTLNEIEIVKIAKKIAIFIKKYINFKLQF